MNKEFALKVIGLTLTLALLGACGEKPEAQIASAKSYQAKGDHPAAIIQFRNALQQNPNVAEARYLLATSLMVTGDDVTAEKELRKALELGYSPEIVVPKIARIMVDQGRADETLKEFGTRPLKDPEAQATLQTVLGDAYAEQDKPKDARAAYTAALTALPGYVPARVGEARLLAGRGEIEEAIKRSDEILKDAPKDFYALNLRATLYVMQRQYKEAVGLYEQMVQMEPQKQSTRRALIGALIFDNQLDKALEQIDAAKKTGGGSDARLVYQEALLQMRKKNYAQARELAQRVLKVLPEHLPSLLISGTADLYLGSLEPAQDALVKVLNRIPRHDAARRLLVTTYLRSGQTGKAMETIEPLLDRPNPDASTLSLAAEVYLAANDMNRAEEYLTRASKLDKDNVLLRTRLGQVHYATGDADAAIEELERASAADSTMVQADLLLVMGYMRNKQYDKATAALEVMEKKQPNNPLTYNVKASLLAAKGDLPGARAALEHALQLKPDNFAALVNLARLDMQDNRPDMARNRFEAAIDKQPKNETLMLTYAKFMAETGEPPEKIIAMVERAAKANPTAEAPRLALIAAKGQTGDTKGMLSAAQEALAAFPNNPRVLEAAGIAQLTAGDVNQAMSTFNKLIQAQPRSATAYGRLAQAQVVAKSPDAALESFRKAMALQPDATHIQSNMIEVMVSMGKFDEALAEARKIQTSQPKNALGFVLEGDVYASQKKWGEALRAYNESLKRNDDNTGIFIKSNRVLELAGRIPDADAQAAKWVKDHPQDTNARVYLAERDLRLKNYKGAVANYKVITQANPKDVLAWNNQAWAANQIKDPAALQYAQKAFELAPDNAAVLDTLGMMLVERGQAEKGLLYMERAYKLAPQVPAIHLNYAKALTQAGKKDAARMELQALAKSDNAQIKTEAEQLLKAL